VEHSIDNGLRLITIQVHAQKGAHINDHESGQRARTTRDKALKFETLQFVPPNKSKIGQRIRSDRRCRFMSPRRPREDGN
jgi:hypothetical protein